MVVGQARPGPGQDRVQGDPVREPRDGDRRRRDRLLRRHLLDHRQAQGAGLLRRPVLRRRSGPAGAQGRHLDGRRQDRPEGQEGLLGDRLDPDPAGQGRAAHRGRQHLGVQDLLRVRRRSCSTRRSTPSPPTTRSSRATPRNAPDELRVVGKPFSTEKYGIGLPKDDKALRDKVNADPGDSPSPTAPGSRSTTRRSASPARRATPAGAREVLIHPVRAAPDRRGSP